MSDLPTSQKMICRRSRSVANEMSDLPTSQKNDLPTFQKLRELINDLGDLDYL